MKKYIVMALLAIMGMGVVFAAYTKPVAAGKAETLNNTASKKAVVISGFLVQKNKKKFNVPEARSYSSSCGTWTVTGAELGTTTEQDYCNQACSNGWTWWKWENGQLTGGTGTPPTGGGAPQ